MDHASAEYKSVYKLPSFLNESCTPEAYRRWLTRKARTHVKRDRARGNDSATIEEYKKAIHLAVERCGGLDEYTGRPLQWDLISRYNNDESRKRGRDYKKGFSDLPTVDHVADGLGPPDFFICSWRVNDAKNDLDLNEFRQLCSEVLAYPPAVRA